MPYNIHVRNPHTPASDHAQIVAAFNTFIASLRALPGGKYVDAGGSEADGVRLSADEIDPTKKPRGDGGVW